jgi:hypothetical protein
MERGFTVDMGYGDALVGTRHVSKWAPGAPLKSFLFKTWVPKNSLPIGTVRCPACGYLESYAAEEFASLSNPRFSLRALLIFMTLVAVVLGMIGAAIWRNAR